MITMAELYREEIVRVDLGSPLRRYSVGKVLATGDDRANRFGAEVFRRGAAVSLDGGKVNGYFIPPEGEALLLDGSATGNTAYVELHGACYAQEGRFSLAVKVTADGVTTTLCVFDGWIVATSTDEVRDPGGIVPSLDDILEKIADMEAATEDAEAAADAAEAAREGIQGDLATLSGQIGDILVNSFDKDNYNTAKFYIAPTTLNFNASDERMIYIPCKPATTYRVSKSVETIMRVGSGTIVPTKGAVVSVLVSSVNPADAVEITTGEADAYLYVQLWIDSTDAALKDMSMYIDNLVISDGSYVPLTEQVKTVDSKVDKLNGQIEGVSAAQRSRYVFSFPFGIDQIHLSDYDGFEDLREWLPADIHERLQALCDQAEGYASYTLLGNDADGNPLYKYVLEPNVPYLNCSRNESVGRDFDGDRIDTPTVIIISGIHGTEISNDYAICHFIKNLITARNEQLNFIFQSVRLVIVPCACPSGLNVDVYENSAGVNLNRDFGVTADAIPTQPECRYIKQVIDEYPDAALMLDMHTHKTYDIMSWNYTDSDAFQHAITRTQGALVNALLAKYPDVEFDLMNGAHDPYTKVWVYSAPNVTGTSTTYAHLVHGIPCGTVETRRMMPLTNIHHGKDAVAYSYDTLVNCLVQFCRTI